MAHEDKGRGLRTCAFLVAAGDSMTMPLNKVTRYIEDGSEHSVSCDARLHISGLRPSPEFVDAWLGYLPSGRQQV